MFDSTLTITLFYAGTLIIILLSTVAVYLLWQLHLRKKRDQQLQLKYERKAKKAREDNIDSLRIIAKCYLAEQVELSEAGIRISRLMDMLELSDAQRSPYKVFDQIHKKLAHIPIFQDWEALPKKEKRGHTETIARVEEEYKDFAVDAAKQMTNFELAKAKFYSA